MDTTYILDSENRIISVSGYWDEFADQNNGNDVHASNVCGRSIWDFIKGDVTRMWLESVFQFARLKNQTVERPYRCDSPDVKRFMQMRISTDENGLLRIDHELLATEKREKPVHFQYASSAVNNLIFRCSICGHVSINNVWVEPEQIPRHNNENIRVSYTVCPTCRQNMPGL